MAIRISTAIVKKLTEQGLIPAHCSKLELLVPPASAMSLRYEVYVTDQHLEILGAAFTEMAAEARAKNYSRPDIPEREPDMMWRGERPK